jgi:hypothetical protein
MRKDCIHTASGIFALCKRLHSKQVESGLRAQPVYCALKLVNEIILNIEIVYWAVRTESLNIIQINLGL